MLFPKEQYTSTRISGGKQSIIVTSSSISVHYLMQCEFMLQFPKYADLLLKIANTSVAFLKVNSNFARKYFVCNKLSHQNNPLQFPSRIPMCFNPHFALNPQILQAIKKRKRFFHLPTLFSIILPWQNFAQFLFLFSQVEEISFSFDGVTNVNQLSVRAQHRRTRGHQHCSL